MSYKCKKCQSGNIDLDSTYTYHDIYTCQDCKQVGYFKIEDCCRKPFLIVTILRHDHDLFFLYHQCLNCFGAVKTLPLKAKEYSEQIRAEFNQWRFEEWKEAKKIEGNEIYAGIRHDNYKNSDKLYISEKLTMGFRVKLTTQTAGEPVQQVL